MAFASGQKHSIISDAHLPAPILRDDDGDGDSIITEQPSIYTPGYPYYIQIISGRDGIFGPTNNAIIGFINGHWTILDAGNNIELKYLTPDSSTTLHIPPNVYTVIPVPIPAYGWDDMNGAIGVDYWDIYIICDDKTDTPTNDPTNEPTGIPSQTPTIEPTREPTTAKPTFVSTQEPIGKHFNRRGIDGNDVKQTNVPNIRLLFRDELLAEEENWILGLPPPIFPSPTIKLNPFNKHSNYLVAHRTKVPFKLQSPSPKINDLIITKKVNNNGKNMNYNYNDRKIINENEYKKDDNNNESLMLKIGNVMKKQFVLVAVGLFIGYICCYNQ